MASMGREEAASGGDDDAGLCCSSLSVMFELGWLQVFERDESYSR
jgi:hypothetical protein